MAGNVRGLIECSAGSAPGTASAGRLQVRHDSVKQPVRAETSVGAVVVRAKTSAHATAHGAVIDGFSRRKEDHVKRVAVALRINHRSGKDPGAYLGSAVQSESGCQ